MNIVLWNLTVLEGSGINTGDKAIIASMISSLKRANPDAKITVISEDPENVQRLFGVNAVKMKRISHAVKEADLFIVSGGEIVRDSSCLLYTPAVLSGPLLATFMGKPVMYYSVEIADPDEISKMGKMLTQRLVKKASLITVRNTESKYALDSLGVTKPTVHVTADPAFALSPAKPQRGLEILEAEGIKMKDCPLIGIMPRRVFPQSASILPVNLRLKLNMLSMDTCNRLQKSIAQSADYLIEKTNANIAFFPMYVGSKFGYGDDTFATKILNSMHHRNKAKMVTGNYTPEEILSVFGHMDLAIGTPLHSIILATAACVPTVSISYSLKTDRFINMLGQQDMSIRAENVNPEVLTSKIKNVWAEREKLKKNIRGQVQLLRKKALINVDLTCKLIDSLN